MPEAVLEQVLWQVPFGYPLGTEERPNHLLLLAVASDTLPLPWISRNSRGRYKGLSVCLSYAHCDGCTASRCTWGERRPLRTAWPA